MQKYITPDPNNDDMVKIFVKSVLDSFENFLEQLENDLKQKNIFIRKIG